MSVGGFMGFGVPKSVQQSEAGLNNIFNFALPQAESSIGPAAAFYKSVLSGNPTAANAAIAPEKNAVAANSDAQRRQAATMGTARGGGTATRQAGQQDADMAKIQNLLFGTRSAAAGESGKLGSSLLATGTGAAKDLGDVSVADSAANQAALNGEIHSAVDAFLGPSKSNSPGMPSGNNSNVPGYS
jgi:hypothetical protein